MSWLGADIGKLSSAYIPLIVLQLEDMPLINKRTIYPVYSILCSSPLYLYLIPDLLKLSLKGMSYNN